VRYKKTLSRWSADCSARGRTFWAQMRQRSPRNRPSSVRKCHPFGLDHHLVFKPVALPDVHTGVRRRLTSRMGWVSGIRALTSIMATNCRCACFLPRMPVFSRSGSLIPDLFCVFYQPVRFCGWVLDGPISSTRRVFAKQADFPMLTSHRC
jgi:hypothetical protein